MKEAGLGVGTEPRWCFARYSIEVKGRGKSTYSYIGTASRQCLGSDMTETIRTANPIHQLRLENADLKWSRFFAKITVEENGCWIWIGAKRKGGYGSVRQEGQSRSPHRLSYEFFVAPIPPHLVIDHLCKTPACVNPSHLEPVTVRENTFVRSDKGYAKVLARRTHCPQGHPYDATNTYRYLGLRSCKTCSRERTRQWRRSLALQREVS